MEDDIPLSDQEKEHMIAEFAEELEMYDARRKFENASAWYIDVATRAKAYSRQKDCEPMDAGILRVFQTRLEISFLEMTQRVIDCDSSFDERVEVIYLMMQREMRSRHERLASLLHPWDEQPSESFDTLKESVETAFLFHDDNHLELTEQILDYYHADVRNSTNDVIETLGLYAPGERRIRAMKRLGQKALDFMKIAGEDFMGAMRFNSIHFPISSSLPLADQPHTSPLWRSNRLE